MSGGIAGRGRPGPAGPAGPMGPTGPQGEPAFTLAIGNVSAVPYGQEPAATNVGTAQDQIWDLALVTGATGVLTGPAPPTGADGTSLGQLYFCTANQMYYGLIELNENDNKWRPIMTNVDDTQTTVLDVIAVFPAQDNKVQYVGNMALTLDDVRQTATLVAHIGVNIPIGQGALMAVDPVETEKIRSLCYARGITALPVVMATVINGGEPVTESFNLFSRRASASFQYDHVDVPGTGTDPGLKVEWQDGRIVSKLNATGAPGASTYGNVSVTELEAGRWWYQFASSAGDENYATIWYCSTSTKVVYND